MVFSSEPNINCRAQVCNRVNCLIIKLWSRHAHHRFVSPNPGCQSQRAQRAIPILLCVNGQVTGNKTHACIDRSSMIWVIRTNRCSDIGKNNARACCNCACIAFSSISIERHSWFVWHLDHHSHAHCRALAGTEPSSFDSVQNDEIFIGL